MTEKLRFLAATQCGVFLRRQAMAVGYSPKEVQRRLRSEEWIAVRRGAYAIAKDWAAMTVDERHRAQCFAVTAKISPDAAVSHVSALAVHRLPTWGHDLSEIHVSSANVSRHAGGVFHHRTSLPHDHVVLVSGMPVTAVPRGRRTPTRPRCCGEKKREDRLRAMGFEVVRITWEDLYNVNTLGAKVRAAFARDKARKGPPSDRLTRR